MAISTLQKPVKHPGNGAQVINKLLHCSQGTLMSLLLGSVATIAYGQTTAPEVPESRRFALEEVVVTARRREERLQDVPVSMTVFSDAAIRDQNIFSASDIATYTPSLHANPRFGSENTTFAIRGFSQELRTTSSVGVYFAEVIAPRGANTQQSGDGAGPGDFFDLENVQVLKGPQGTLFGRNTTGGAVLLTPKKPTDEFEGYVEGSAGNYDMRRLQGVVNVPINDALRIRLGVDTQERDGYLRNVSDIGPKDFADVDYTAFRGSVVWDITDNIENYTIFKYAKSENNGYPSSMFVCNEGLIGTPRGGNAAFCQADLNAREARGARGFYDVANPVLNPSSKIEHHQVINTTTWDINDNLTLKNILSYTEYETSTRNATYGTDWHANLVDAAGNVIGTQPLIFQMSGLQDGRPSSDNEVVVEELQLQGSNLDGRLTWQAGVYYEKTKPGGEYGAQSPATISCLQETISSPNPADWRCNDLMGGGSVATSPGKITYENKAVYFQGSYEFTDQWSATLGLRYTEDETKGWVREEIYRFPQVLEGGYYPYSSFVIDERRPTAKSEEPTWLVGVDYKPTEDTLIYAKYARGYRQGSVNLASVAEWNTHEPEQVDTYEIGMKTEFYGPVPGNFNVALFYNDFKDQQVQFGYFTKTGVGTTSIINAGSSTIWGLEVDSMLYLTENLTLSASYAYLDTEVDEIAYPSVIPDSILVLGGATAAEGEPLSYSPKNKLVLSLNYQVPIDEALGELSAGVTYVYTDKRQAVTKATSIYATLPSYDLINANLNWNSVMGSRFDLSLFATNVTNEKYITYMTGNWNNGLESGQVGQPRMYGARVRYNF